MRSTPADHRRPPRPRLHRQPKPSLSFRPRGLVPGARSRNVACKLQVRVTPKVKNSFTIRALPISGVTWKWHVLNHAPESNISSVHLKDDRRSCDDTG